MKIKVPSVYVDDQDKALRFYTEVLGFAKKTDFSQRAGMHCLTAAKIWHSSHLPASDSQSCITTS